MTPKQILDKHPAPWIHRQVSAGVLVMFDAADNVVDLFTVIDFVQGVTQNLAQATAASATA